MKFQLLLLGGALNCGISLAAGSSSLPQVDLGYEVHEAFKYNATGKTYTFSNIRYAQLPVRFAAPVAPAGRNPEVQRGNETRICPQAYASWGSASHEFGLAYLNGNLSNFNYTLEQQKIQALKPLQLNSEMTDNASEDCLFLDVTVPKRVFDRRNSRCSKGAPVLVWLHGGGYNFGHKTDPLDGGDPSGIIQQSMHDGSDGIIFVAPNYRLGAFGWLAGESLDAINGTANVGLHDQRLALEWVQSNIHLFGGDPTQVTLGGSGGSVIHQITAYGGSKGPALFQRAFINSPGYQPIDSNFQVENRTQTLLRLANVTTLAEARELPFEVIRRANAEHVLTADFGFWYGPAVDGDFIPALPGISLNRGKFNNGLNGQQMDLLISHAVYEGGEYNAPWISTDEQFKEALYSNLMPNIKKELADFLTKTMYPGETPVRTIKFGSEYGFSCNTNYLARAFGNKTYNYMYDIYPGFHGYDIPYTFFGSAQESLEVALYPEQAIILQRYMTNFVKHGNPNGKSLPLFPQQGQNASMNVMRKDGWVIERDDTVCFNCEWMQKGLFF